MKYKNQQQGVLTDMRKKIFTHATAAALAALMAFSIPGETLAVKAENDSDFAASMKERFANPEMAHRPYARWWLAEGSHTDETIRESIKELYDAGYGGIEFVTLDESEHLDNETYAWGSKEWIHDSKLIIEECQKLGMSVSMTSGTHWATANLTIINPDMEEASQELGYTVTDSFQGSFQGELRLCSLPEGVTKRRLVSVVAGKILGSTEDGSTVDVNSFEVVSDDQLQIETDEDGNLISVTADYTAPGDGDYQLFAFYQYGTGEYFTPATTGKSYSINYLDKVGAQALIKYWDENVLTDDLQEIIDQIDECDLYMDSLELNTKGEETVGHLWSTQFLDEFKNRMGYDLTPYLPLIIRYGGDWGAVMHYNYEAEDEENADFCKKLRNDFYQVMTELYTENSLEVLADWLHGKNMKLRAENSYGKTLEISQPIAALDYVETESFEFGNEIDSYRSMAGGAHLLNKRFSSETGALGNGNYRYNNGYFRQIFYMQYAAGIQKTVTHGYSSSYGPDANVSWPGYEGMYASISERFNKRQPGSVDYAEVNQHLSRIQKALEEGAPQMDLAILRTEYNLNAWTVGFADGNDVYNNLTHNHVGMYWQDMELQNAGYTYDFFSPYLLNADGVSCSNKVINEDGAAYQAVIVMEEELPFAAAQTLLDWAKSGLPVVFVNNAAETINFGDPEINEAAAITTGHNDGKDEELADIVSQIKSLDNVRTVDSEADAYEALQELGVQPRAQQVTSNDKVLTALRKAEDASYLYAYNYMYEDTDDYVGQISIEGTYTPYELDTWSGDVTLLSDYEVSDGRTVLNVDLTPGDTVVYILDPAEVKETAGTEETKDPAEHISLTGWNLTVDSFEAGEKLERTEENPDTGVTTTEVTYDTNHNMINAGVQDILVPWKEIPAVGENVSGIGIYTTSFELPENWNEEEKGIYFSADNVNYGTVSVFVNGEKVPVNMDAVKAELTNVVKAGENTIEVRVTSSLKNVLRSMNYIVDAEEEPADYGMTGNTELVIYEK